MSVYAVSDLHGRYDLFLKGLDKICFKDSDELYVIGDAIDRGPDGIKILQHIKNYKNMSLIIGNHEVMMLLSVNPDGKKKCNGEKSELWLYYNGGSVTWERFAKLREKDRKSLILWLNRCHVIKTIEVEGKRFCLTHSYYSEDLENKMYFEADPGEVWDVVWTSMFREDYDTHGGNIYKDYEYQFITGHVPVQKAALTHGRRDDFNELRPYEVGNLIDIDGGCARGYFPGFNNGAIFLRLNDMKVYPIPMDNN